MTPSWRRAGPGALSTSCLSSGWRAPSSRPGSKTLGRRTGRRKSAGPPTPPACSLHGLLFPTRPGRGLSHVTHTLAHLCIQAVRGREPGLTCLLGLVSLRASRSPPPSRLRPHRSSVRYLTVLQLAVVFAYAVPSAWHTLPSFLHSPCEALSSLDVRTSLSSSGKLVLSTGQRTGHHLDAPQLQCYSPLPARGEVCHLLCFLWSISNV